MRYTFVCMSGKIKYSIRAIKPGDVDELLVLLQEHALFERADFQPNGKKEKLTTAIFNPSPKLYCWVVETDTGLNGFATYTIDYSTWDAANFIYLDCLFLRAVCRGMGIGSEIISRLKDRAIAENCVAIQWQTPPFNKDAINFYLKKQAQSSQKVRFKLSVV